MKIHSNVNCIKCKRLALDFTPTPANFLSFIFTHSLTTGCRRINPIYGRFEHSYSETWASTGIIVNLCDQSVRNKYSIKKMYLWEIVFEWHELKLILCDYKNINSECCIKLRHCFVSHTVCKTVARQTRRRRKLSDALAVRRSRQWGGATAGVVRNASCVCKSDSIYDLSHSRLPTAIFLH